MDIVPNPEGDAHASGVWSLPGSGRDKWCGISERGYQRVVEFARTRRSRDLRDRLSARFLVNHQSPMPYGMPLVVRPAAEAEVRRLVSLIHSLTSQILALYPRIDEIREVISVPPDLPVEDTLTEGTPARQRVSIDLCRMDFLLAPTGAPMLLELNANCPGGVINAGESSRAWREALERETGTPFNRQPFETPDWMATGLIDLFAESHLRIDRVAIIHERTGWRHEVDDIAASFRRVGLDTVLLDPSRAGSEAELSGGVEVGYQKIGVQRLIRIIRDSECYGSQLRSGRLHVQNGHAARFVADNKLCLAVLSEGRFERYFDPPTFRHVQKHLPWSRNIARCSDRELARIRSNPEEFVLKRPLDTRGAGVVVGAAATSLPEWFEHVERAVAGRWLVQERVASTRIERWPGEQPVPHDLSVFCLDGRPVGAFARGSRHEKLNVPRGGHTHPIVVAPDGWE